MNSRGRSGTIALSSVFCTGQLAGMMLAIAIAQAAAQHLPEESWTLRHAGNISAKHIDARRIDFCVSQEITTILRSCGSILGRLHRRYNRS
jgi:hypothetical protein